MRKSPSLSKLENLMRSLTQAQRRDFKKYVKFWGGKTGRKYLVLFDAIQQYIAVGKDEKRLKEHLLGREKSEQEPDEVITAAKYLYRKILESMRTTPDAAPHFNRLNALMQDIGFLYAKNLFSDAQALVNEALKLAQDLDKPNFELELNFWKKKLLLAQNSLTPEISAEWLQAQQHLSNVQQTLLNYEKLENELNIFFRKKEKLPQALDKQVKAILIEMDNGLPEQLTVRAKIRLYSSLSHYFDLQYALAPGKTESGLVKKSRAEKSVHFQAKALEVFQSNKIFAEDEQPFFMNVLGNYLNRCLRFEQTELMKELEEQLTKSKNDFLKYRLVAYQRLQHLLKTNKFEHARAYFEENKVADGIEKYKHQMPETRLLALYFTVGQIYYSLNDFDRASDWFGRAAQMRVSINTNVVLVSKVLEIISLREYGAYDDDPTRPVKNLRRSLRRAGLMDDFMTKTLDAVEILFRNSDSLSETQLPSLLSKLRHTYEDDKTKSLYGMILAWFDARLNGNKVSDEIINY
jgi:hypothetical protein